MVVLGGSIVFISRSFLVISPSSTVPYVVHRWFGNVMGSTFWYIFIYCLRWKIYLSYNSLMIIFLTTFLLAWNLVYSIFLNWKGRRISALVIGIISISSYVDIFLEAVILDAFPGSFFIERVSSVECCELTGFYYYCEMYQGAIISRNSY